MSFCYSHQAGRVAVKNCRCHLCAHVKTACLIMPIQRNTKPRYEERKGEVPSKPWNQLCLKRDLRSPSDKSQQILKSSQCDRNPASSTLTQDVPNSWLCISTDIIDRDTRVNSAVHFQVISVPSALPLPPFLSALYLQSTLCCLTKYSSEQTRDGGSFLLKSFTSFRRKQGPAYISFHLHFGSPSPWYLCAMMTYLGFSMPCFFISSCRQTSGTSVTSFPV